MKINITNILTLAQKEFADNLHSSRFRTVLLFMMLIICSDSFIAAKSGLNIFEEGFFDVVSIMGLFLPVVGISLGFDSVVKEMTSNSLNTLLTHPIFRDNIIMGKITGGFLTLAMVIVISIISSVGIMLILTGMQISWVEFNRILIFTAVSFIYISTFFALGVLFSILCNNPAKSFIFCMALWIIFVMVFGPISSLVASMATGEALYSDYDEHAQIIYNKLQYFSPFNHYSQVIIGYGLSTGETDQKISAGIFDINHTFEEWLKDYWTNLVGLIVIPILLLISSILIFLNKDIKRCGP